MPAFALIIWPLVAIVLFAALGRSRGLIWTVVAGYLLLPEAYEFDLPLLQYGKGAAVGLGALLAAVLVRPARGVDDTPETLADPFLWKCLLALLAVHLMVPVGTFVTNPEALVNGEVVRPGLSPKDVVAVNVQNIIFLLPLLLAWRFLRSPDSQRHLLFAMVVMGLFYSLLALFELRMSPQLNNWVYGYFPHSWLQHIRGGGYRPVVFLRHGLWLGMFLLTTVIAAMALARSKDAKIPGSIFFMAGCWLFLVLAVSRNMGALLLGVLFVPLVFVLTVRAQFRVATAVSAVFLFYPMLYGVLNSLLQNLVGVFQAISPERAASFLTRINNEAQLIARGLEKPLFGWGGWGRMRILDEAGRDVSLVDGAWIIAFGNSGWFGYLSYFGLMIVPILLMSRSFKRKPPSPVVGGMALLSAANLVYLIPNSALSPISFLVFGAIAAYAVYDPVETRAEAGPDPVPDRKKVRYSRFAPQSSPSRSGSSPQRPAVSTRYSSRSRARSGA